MLKLVGSKTNEVTVLIVAWSLETNQENQAFVGGFWNGFSRGIESTVS